MPTNRHMRVMQRDRRPLLACEERPLPYARWVRHRDWIMAQEARNGRRPEEWWVYEKRIQAPERERETVILLEMGELQGTELASVTAEWRRKWEQAQENHGYCCGHKPGSATEALWLDGVQARKAWIRFWGLPVKLVRQWGRERRRSAKLVRELVEQSHE